MTDMHRETFERWIDETHPYTKMRALDGAEWAHKKIASLSEGFCAAIRHLTEQNEQRNSHE